MNYAERTKLSFGGVRALSKPVSPLTPPRARGHSQIGRRPRRIDHLSTPSVPPYRTGMPANRRSRVYRNRRRGPCPRAGPRRLFDFSFVCAKRDGVCRIPVRPVAARTPRGYGQYTRFFVNIRPTFSPLFVSDF